MSDVNLKVAMIGPRGCGKTSVLSIMLGEIENFINGLNANENVRRYCNPSVSADAFSVNLLSLTYEKLQSVAKRNVVRDGVNVVLGTDIAKPRIYNIDLIVSGITTTISFYDYSGAFFLPEYHNRIKREVLEDFKNVFATADVILLCVDVPSQITYSDTNDNRYRDSYKNYITSLIRESSNNHSHNGIAKTIIVAPVKCEATILDTVRDEITGYMQKINPEKNNTLYNNVKSLYNDLFTHLENSQTVQSFYLPIITMGCVKATGIEYDPCEMSSHVNFEPIIRGQNLHYYQCNSSSLLALSLWSAGALITRAYANQAGVLARIRHFFNDKWPTEWFKDELFEKCSLYQILWDYISNSSDYRNLSEEEKKKFNDLKSAAESQPFTGCRLI